MPSPTETSDRKTSGGHFWKDVWVVLKTAATGWIDDNVPKLSAALAYYTVFSLAPLLVIAIFFLSTFLGKAAAQGQVTAQIQGAVGGKAAEAIQTMIQSASQKHSGTLATIISVVILIAAASGVFGELQNSMNIIWGVQPQPKQGIWGLIRARVLSIGMVFSLLFLLLVSLIVSTALTAVLNHFGGGVKFLSVALDIVLSLAVVSLLFGMLFKFVPDVEITWTSVWLGAFSTAALFAIGKWLLAWYLRMGSTTSAYGAAGSLAALLIWVYYSAQILFFGTEVTEAYANLCSKTKPRPSAHAVWIGELIRENLDEAPQAALPAFAAREERRREASGGKPVAAPPRSGKPAAAPAPQRHAPQRPSREPVAETGSVSWKAAATLAAATTAAVSAALASRVLRGERVPSRLRRHPLDTAAGARRFQRQLDTIGARLERATHRVDRVTKLQDLIEKSNVLERIDAVEDRLRKAAARV